MINTRTHTHSDILPLLDEISNGGPRKSMLKHGRCNAMQKSNNNNENACIVIGKVHKFKHFLSMRGERTKGYLSPPVWIESDVEHMSEDDTDCS